MISEKSRTSNRTMPTPIIRNTIQITSAQKSKSSLINNCSARRQEVVTHGSNGINFGIYFVRILVIYACLICNTRCFF